MNRKDLIDHLKNTIRLELETIDDLYNRLDESFASAVEMIYQIKGKVIITGVGKSGLIAQKIAATMLSTGTIATFLHPNDALHGDLGMAQKNDAIIMISKSGESDELIAMIPVLKKLAIQIIAITANQNSTIAKNATLHLYTPIKKEACPLDLAPTSSTTVALVLGDALAMALMKLKNFKSEDFAFSHPAGRLGKRLILQVKDLMKTGDQNATVPTDAKISAILDAFSKGGNNAVTVINDDDTLAGTITSYDLRKAIQDKPHQFINLCAADILQKNPVTITQNQLAFEAFQLMINNKNTLNFLIVMEQEKSIGIITLQDLVKAGL